MPLISIIIPSFNSAETIAETIDSILQQDYKHVEVLIMDALSADGTAKIVEHYTQTNANIAFYSEKDKGVYDAMNKGIAKATGDYLYFMGSDDVFYEPNTLSKLSPILKSGADFVYGNIQFKHNKRIYSGESNIEKLMIEQISICHQAIFYAKRVFDVVGSYDLKYHIHADYDFNIRCFKNESIRTKYTDQIIAIFNENGLSGTSSNADGFHTWLTNVTSEREAVLALYYQNRKLKNDLRNIESSNSYKLGSLILSPLKLVKKIVK